MALTLQWKWQEFEILFKTPMPSNFDNKSYKLKSSYKTFMLLAGVRVHEHW